ncbi:MAG TPA: pentapeptide repeat-containing protein [Rhizomicrobium sp.]|nr:pentapeptide repeat-containing protein [Rhizomicrobium sp.]
MLKDPYGKKLVKLSQQDLNTVLHGHARFVAHQGGLRAQLAHANLDGLNLANRNLEEVDFTGASLVGASLYGSNLHRVSLYCADLRGCDLRYTKLTRADLRGASFRGARLSFSMLDNADLRSGTMMYAGVAPTVGTTEHHGVDFSNCSMKGVSFGNAKLDGADFTGALLHGAVFKNANITNAVFKDAVLTGVNLEELKVPPESLAGAIRDVAADAVAKAGELKARLQAHEDWIASDGKQGAPAALDGADLRPLGKQFSGRKLAGLSARGTIGIEADFSGSALQAGKFDGADLRGANFSRADLRGVSFKNAKLAHALFEGANLGALRLADGNMLAADFTGAVVTDEQMRGALRDPS